MADILSLTLPIYALIALGALAVRAGWVSGEQMTGMGQVVLKLCLPALILGAVLRAGEGGALDWSFMAAYLIASAATIAAGALVMRRVLGQPAGLSWILGLGMGAPNSLFVGFPVAALAFGTGPAGAMLANLLLVENVILIPLALVLADVAGPGSAGAAAARAVRGLVASPLVWAVVLGLALTQAGLALPEPAMRTLALLSAVAPGAALLAVGGAVACRSVRAEGLPAGVVAAGKLIVHPLALLAAMALVPGIGAEARAMGLVFAAAPMLTIFPILGARHGGEALCAAALIVATTLSFVTVSAALLWAG